MGSDWALDRIEKRVICSDESWHEVREGRFRGKKQDIHFKRVQSSTALFDFVRNAEYIWEANYKTETKKKLVKKGSELAVKRMEAQRKIALTPGTVKIVSGK